MTPLASAFHVSTRPCVQDGRTTWNAETQSFRHCDKTHNIFRLQTGEESVDGDTWLARIAKCGAQARAGRQSAVVAAKKLSKIRGGFGGRA